MLDIAWTKSAQFQHKFTPRSLLHRAVCHVGPFLVLVFSLSSPVSAADGKLDTTFNPPLVPDASGYQAVTEVSGSIYLSGNGKLHRLSQTGVIDTSYNPPIRTTEGGASGYIEHLATDTDGKLTLTGQMYSPDGLASYGLVRLLSSGEIDPQFTTYPLVNGAGFYQYITQSNVLPDGRFLLGINTYNALQGDSSDQLVLLGKNGVVDPSVALSGNGLYMDELSDGRYLASGLPLKFDGQDRWLQRYTAAMTVDPGFIPPTLGTDGFPHGYPIVVEDDAIPGSLFVGFGSGVDGFTINDTPAKFLYHLNADGAVDGGFLPYVGTTIPAGYEFSSFDLQDRNATTLLVSIASMIFADPVEGAFQPRKLSRTTGIVDGSFNPEIRYTGDAGDIFVSLVSGGKVEVVFDRGFEDITVNNMVLPAGQRRFWLNADGTLDSTYTPPSGPAVIARDNQGNAEAVDYYEYELVDGRTLLLTNDEVTFTEVNGQPRSGIALMRSDGTLDPDFKPTLTFSANLYNYINIDELASGDLLLTGTFTAIDGQSRPAGVAKLLMEATVSPGVTYADWATTHSLPPVASATQDTDLDGVPDVVEYASNLNPRVPDAGEALQPGESSGVPLVGLIGEGEARRLRIQFLRPVATGPGAVSAIAEFSSGPAAGWQEVTVPVSTEPALPGWERVVVDDVVTMATTGVRLGRVRIRYAP